jgi:OFA family oxalate/formate antiporter-like MFS transporter
MSKSNAAAKKEVGEVQEEGFKAKSIGLITFLFIMMYIQISLTGPESMNLVLPAVEKAFGWAPADVAVKISIVRLVSIVAMVLAGTLFIKIGIKKVMIPSGILAGLSVIIMGNVTTLNMFAWCNIGMNIFYPVYMVALGALTANWYVRKRGRALGIITIAFPLSTATFTLIGTKTIAAFSYQAFYNTVGVLSILFSLLAIWLVHDKPESVAMSPDGIPFTEKEKADIAERQSYQSQWNFWRVMKTKEIWAYAFVWAFIGMVLGGIMSQMIPVFTSTGLSVNKALGMLSAAALVGMPLSYIWGWLDDKFGTPTTTMIFSFVLIIGCVGMAYGSAENTVPFYLAILCVALGSAGMPNLQPSLLAYIVGRQEYVNINRYTNVIHMISVSFSMSFVPVTYAIVGSYKPVFLSLSIFAVLAIVLVKFTRKSFDPERMEFIKEGKVQ